MASDVLPKTTRVKKEKHSTTHDGKRQGMAVFLWRLGAENTGANWVVQSMVRVGTEHLEQEFEVHCTKTYVLGAHHTRTHWRYPIRINPEQDKT